MFLNWLIHVFPGEMRRGWELLRPNLALWVLVSAAVALVSRAVGHPRVAADPALQATVTAAGALAMLYVLVAAVLFFEAVDEQRHVAWTDVSACFARRALPLIASVFGALAVSAGCAAAAMFGLGALLTGTPFGNSTVSIFGMLIYVTLLVRFCFVPFAVVLHHKDTLPARLRSTEGLAKVGWLVAWPLAASSSISLGIGWKLAPYVALPYILRLAAGAIPELLLLPYEMGSFLVFLVTQAVLFRFFRARLAALAA